MIGTTSQNFRTVHHCSKSILNSGSVEGFSSSHSHFFSLCLPCVHGCFAGALQGLQGVPHGHDCEVRGENDRREIGAGRGRRTAQILQAPVNHLALFNGARLNVSFVSNVCFFAKNQCNGLIKSVLNFIFVPLTDGNFAPEARSFGGGGGKCLTH